jgi:hypothetical protein
MPVGQIGACSAGAERLRRASWSSGIATRPCDAFCIHPITLIVLELRRRFGLGKLAEHCQ